MSLPYIEYRDIETLLLIIHEHDERLNNNNNTRIITLPHYRYLDNELSTNSIPSSLILSSLIPSLLIAFSLIPSSLISPSDATTNNDTII